MIITLDCDNDTVRVDHKSRKIKGDMNQIKDVIFMILDQLDESRLSSATPTFDIVVERQSDGQVYTVRED